MRTWCRLAIGVIVLASWPLTAVQQEGGFRTAVDLVPVFVTVTDQNDRLVPNLDRSVFEVRDNGKPQPLTLFDDSPRPLRLIVMLDVSGSMTGNLPLLRAASLQLFQQLGENDRAKVGTFGNDVVISPEFTNNRSALMATIPLEIDPLASTVLWRGVYDGMGAFGETGEARRVVLVLSDGKDSPPMKFGAKMVTQLDIVERARREDVMIYAVGMRSRHPMGPIMPGINIGAMMAADLPDPGLAMTATESGGGYFELLPKNDLGVTFGRVLEELHSQYLLGYAPPVRDGKVHKVEVRVTTKGLKPRSRKSYLAPKGSG